MNTIEKQLDTTIRRPISLLKKLPEYAISRHGWGDDNSGFGVIYPSDLDEYDKVVDGSSIPDGYVEVYGFWGLRRIEDSDGYEFQITEISYMAALIRVLQEEQVDVNIEALISLHHQLMSASIDEST